MDYRKQYCQQYEKSEKRKETQKKHQKDAVKKLKPSYVKRLLKHEGFTQDMITAHPELIEIKKLTLQINRLWKT